MSDEKTQQEQHESQQKIKEALHAYGSKEATRTLDSEQEIPAHLADDPDILHTELMAAQTLAKENWDKYLRLQAEMQNLQRRAERDIANAHRYSLEKFVDGLLPIIDSLERALETMQTPTDELKAFHEGVELTYKMFIDCLTKFNVKQINPQHEPFNPEQHEAISMHETEDAANGTILMVVQKGYDLNGRIVRPARVVVAKNKM